MSKITDKDLNSMSLEDLRSLSKRVKLAEKAHRQAANKEVASVLSAGDKVEFTLPKSNDVHTGIVVKVKRVMVSIKPVNGGAAKWNVPLTTVKKLESAVVKAVKKTASVAASKKSTKPSVKPVVKAAKPVVKKTSSVIDAIKEKVMIIK